MSTLTLDTETGLLLETITDEDELEDYYADLKDGADDPDISLPSTAELVRDYYKTPQWLIDLGNRRARERAGTEDR